MVGVLWVYAVVYETLYKTQQSTSHGCSHHPPPTPVQCALMSCRIHSCSHPRNVDAALVPNNTPLGMAGLLTRVYLESIYGRTDACTSSSNDAYRLFPAFPALTGTPAVQSAVSGRAPSRSRWDPIFSTSWSAYMVQSSMLRSVAAHSMRSRWFWRRLFRRVRSVAAIGAGWANCTCKRAVQLVCVCE